MERLEQEWKRYKMRQFSETDLAGLVHDLGESALIHEPDVREELVRLMSSADPLVRQNALGALAYHGVAVDWLSEFGEQLLSAIDIMLRLDDDRDCRRQAAAALGSLFKNTRDRAVMGALGRICSNVEESDDVRSFAFTALLSVASVPLRDQPNPVGLRLGPAEMMRVSELVS